MNTNNSKNVYAQDGVNVQAGDLLSQYAKELTLKTYQNSPFVKVHTNNGDNYFRAPVSYSFKGIPEGCTLFSCADSVATKTGIYQAAGIYYYAGFDLLAMVLDDTVRYGNLPLIVTNLLNIDSAGDISANATIKEKFSFRAAKMVMNGVYKAAKDSNIVLIGGETAEKGIYVGSDLPLGEGLRFDLEAVAHGLTHPQKLITGDSLAAGQIVIALKENGFRSNGISSVRTAFKIKFDKDWWNNPEAKEYLQLAAEPSIIYSNLITKLNGWHAPDFKPEVRLHAIAHITGGGIEGKLGKDFLFRKGLSARLDNLFDPPKIMFDCRKWRGMTESEAYTTWNGGQGMLVVVDNDEASINHVITTAALFGINAKVSGSIYKWRYPRIEIKSKFSRNRVLKYFP